MRRETLVYFLFTVVTSLIILSLPIFVGSAQISVEYLLLVLFAMSIIWFIVRTLYYKRLRERQTQD